MLIKVESASKTLFVTKYTHEIEREILQEAIC